MGRYYFATDENGTLDPDEEGLEFASFKAACDDAEKALREMASEAPAGTLSMSVFDENRKLVHRVRLEVTRDVGDSC